MLRFYKQKIFISFSVSSQYPAHNNNNNNNNMDNLDGNCIGRSGNNRNYNDSPDSPDFSPDTNSPLPRGTALMSSSRDAMYYNMNRKIRGLAFIFNHQKYEDPVENPERKGTDVDARKLESCFRKLDFDVHLFNDLRLEEIEFQVDFAVQTDHNKYDCFVMVVLSHGDVDKLSAKDQNYNPKEVLFDRFTSDKCLSLAGKPKLFFIQACQGGGLDYGIRLVDRKISRTEHDGLRSPYRIPVLADFLIMYATCEGQYAFRNTHTGSFFITVLCEELGRLSHTENLLTILTVVIRRVAVEFVSNNEIYKDYHDRKQVPYFHSALTRLVRFQRDYILDNNNGQPGAEFISTKRI
ncbi:unnamed protein product [Phaedon cochleariae]|uniref:Caspase n=1 Tax=Phaedon cochleariae TaxID=80249 RepID=A0A9P0DUE8_PHACE|nr:unnamed protein product [Phaedon cochleariae]